MIYFYKNKTVFTILTLFYYQEKTISVLGINLSHDTSVFLIKDAKIYIAEEERWSKLKHHSSYTEDYIFPHNALEYVLKESNTSLKDIQHTICVSMSAKDMLGDYLFPRNELKKSALCILYFSSQSTFLSGFSYLHFKKLLDYALMVEV